MEKLRTRYAPSPTGYLHVGGARTALYNYLLARQTGGEFLLRIEDTDRERHDESAVGKIVADLRWLGIEWDEGVEVGGPYGPYRQSERLDLYAPHIDRLLETAVRADPSNMYLKAGKALALRLTEPRGVLR